nr:hypothetical protein P9270_018725 [Mesorhizobium sp. WSM4875]
MEIVRLNDLSRWDSLPAGQSLVFEAGAPRKLCLQLNCRGRSALFISHHDEVTGEVEESFLASVPAGLSKVEFFTGGKPFKVWSDAPGAIHYFTAEMEPAAVENLDPEIFTKIAHRRARNPELEQMWFLMNQNMNRRLAQMDADYEQRLAAMAEKGLQDGEEVGRSGGSIHVGAPAQREELAAEDETGTATSPVRGRAPRKAASPAEAGSAGDNGDDGSEEA